MRMYMNFTKRILALSLLLSGTSAVLADQVLVGKIVFADMESIFAPIQKDFDAMRESETKKFQTEMQTMGAKREELAAKMSDLKDDAAKKSNNETIAKFDKQGQDKAQVYQAKMQAEQAKSAKKAEDLVKNIEAIRKDNGWAAVLPKGVALSMDSSLDVTEIIKKGLVKLTTIKTVDKK